MIEVVWTVKLFLYLMILACLVIVFMCLNDYRKGK